jgi:hypothetical protein
MVQQPQPTQTTYQNVMIGGAMMTVRVNQPSTPTNSHHNQGHTTTHHHHHHHHHHGHSNGHHHGHSNGHRHGHSNGGHHHGHSNGGHHHGHSNGGHHHGHSNGGYQQPRINLSASILDQPGCFQTPSYQPANVHTSCENSVPREQGIRWL